MKICRIVSELDFGGVEQRLRLTSDFFLNHTDHELIILVLGSGGRVCQEIENMGVSVKVLNEKVKIPNTELIRKIFNFLRFSKPEVIHTSGAEANFHGIIAGFLVRTPVRIGEEIGFPNHGLTFRFIFKFIYTLSHQVIAISNSVAQRVIEFNELNRNKVSVIYNPVSISGKEKNHENGNFSKNLSLLSSNHKIFVTTCRLVPIKNLKFLIEVFYEYVSTYGNENSLLWIVGEGPEKDELKELTLKYQISDKVVFFGFLNNVIPLLKKADSFILPSFSEGFSISLVEAMLCGLPVISTKIGGPSEIIRHGVNGFLFNPKDRIQLLKLMNRVAKLSEIELGRIKLKAVERGAEFSVKNYGYNLLKLYHTILLK